MQNPICCKRLCSTHSGEFLSFNFNYNIVCPSQPTYFTTYFGSPLLSPCFLRPWRKNRRPKQTPPFSPQYTTFTMYKSALVLAAALASASAFAPASRSVYRESRPDLVGCREVSIPPLWVQLSARSNHAQTCHYILCALQKSRTLSWLCVFDCWLMQACNAQDREGREINLALHLIICSESRPTSTSIDPAPITSLSECILNRI